ncbi:diguanylate cyclase [Candidatus Mycobacterium wuenschmannii]|uniref:Diguanylate cyclase n=1 Tax=Candidatus Mycobacterium wuenschmannii TaxID=3027808 RepID=A0ABY8VX82_9MYCO|nr:diguanylate cyclase [Candidatus Mycobacterium wuenschmannii]WIM86767.1 diguanylate cyclase [Candidatus Mycobacterium wuenschmannii]
MIDHSPLAICVHADGRYVYVNETLVRRMGAKSADELLGRRITDFVHPDSLAAVAAHIAARRHEGDATPPLELTILPLDGTKREVEAIAIRTRWEGQPAHKVIFRDLSEQKETEARLRLQAALVSHVSDAFIATTVTGEITSWNPAAEAIYGRSAARALGLPVSEAVGAPLNPASIVAAGGVEHTTHRAVDGSALAMRVSVSPMSDGYVVLCADQTALRRAEQHFQSVVASLEGGVVVISPRGEVESVNPAALRIMGVPETGVDAVEFAKLASVPIYDSTGTLLSPDQWPVLKTLATSRRQGTVYGVDRLLDGQRIWVSVNWSPLDPTDTARSSVLISFIDVTESHTTQRRLEHQAAHDPLTGLPNRTRVIELINSGVASGQSSLGAVLFIDCDNFKAINDALGHYAGDTVLQIAAQRLDQALRPNDVVGRVGGDEFVALLAAPLQPVEIDDLARRLHAALAEPIAVDHQTDSTATRYVWISASIGLVPFQSADRRSAEEILHDADQAMYQAKRTGQATSRYEYVNGRKPGSRAVLDWLRNRR